MVIVVEKVKISFAVAQKLLEIHPVALAVVGWAPTMWNNNLHIIVASISHFQIEYKSKREEFTCCWPLANGFWDTLYVPTMCTNNNIDV